MKFAEIETARLHLRPLTMDDADDIHRLWIDPQVRKYLWDDEVIPEERAVSIVSDSLISFADNGFGLWGVFPLGRHALIGFCGFWLFHDPPQLQLLYGITPEEWGKGLATEAARAMIGYGFAELGFERIEASTDAANVASIRVLEKAGMVYEKRIVEGEADTVYYAVRRETRPPAES